VKFFKNVSSICQREIGAYFYSPMAYVVLFLFMLTNGILFAYFCYGHASDPRQIPLVVERLFGMALIWMLPLSPLLTMRLFSEEKRTGTIEMLMTAPVREREVVLGKFFAAQGFYMFIWLSIMPLMAILAILGSLDWGPVLAVYIGLFSLGLLTNSLGLLASAATRNQLISAIIALTGNLVFMMASMGYAYFRDDPESMRFLHYLSYTAHFNVDYMRGIVDLRYIFYYASFAALFLFFCTRVVEARKWQ